VGSVRAEVISGECWGRSASRPALISEIAQKIQKSSRIDEGAEFLLESARLFGFSGVSVVRDIIVDLDVLDESNISVNRSIFGWSEEILDWWHNDRIYQWLPDARRCLTSYLPFPSRAPEKSPDPCDAIGKVVRAMWEDHRIRSLLVIPVHTPLGITSVVVMTSEVADQAHQVTEYAHELLTVSHSLFDLIERCNSNDAEASTKKLTTRQLECLHLLLEGMTQKEIARHLSLSHHTVRDHLERAKARLRVSRSSLLLKAALRDGAI